MQEYVGEVVDAETKEDILKKWARDNPNDPNFYVMSLSKGWFIDAREVANLSRFINHSCDPYCVLLPINMSGYMCNVIMALRDIAPGEFLSYDYHFDTRHGGPPGHGVKLHPTPLRGKQGRWILCHWWLGSYY